MLKLGGAEGLDFGFESETPRLCGGRVCEQIEDGEEGACGVLERRRCTRNLGVKARGALENGEGGEGEGEEDGAMIHEFAFRDG